MSLGDAIRGLIDPVPPAVREWLRRELPRLVADGYVAGEQAERIAQRYGVRLDAPLTATTPGVAPVEVAPAVTSPAPGSPPMAATTTPEVPEQPAAAASEAAVAGIGAGRPLPPIPGAPPATAGSLPSQPVAAARPGGSPFLADHAVSIVLYLGAFLVVAAVVIFLSYSWGDISGGGKLGVLAGLTAGFLAAARVCLPRDSVRPAGRTFLALGAILVPANVAATYLVYFENSAIPAALFWLAGAMLSGGLHAALSVRLQSKAYGALAVLAVPVAAAALSWLAGGPDGWMGTAAVLGLIATLAAARRAPSIPLVQAAQTVGVLLLPLAFLATLPFVNDRDADRWGAVLALPLMSLGLAWEATRGGKTWWLGAAITLIVSPFVAIAIYVTERQPWFSVAAAVSGIVIVAAARLLPKERRSAWDAAAIAPALFYPFVAWGQDAACLALFAGFAVMCGIAAWGWRSVVPLYPLVLAVDGAYVKLLAIFGSPDSPDWALGVALWPLGVAWAVAGLAMAGRKGGPAWFGAHVTLAAAGLILGSQHGWRVGVAATAALVSVLAAWRVGLPVLLALAVPWLLTAGYRGAELLGLPEVWRYAAAGTTGWLLLAVSLVRTGRTVDAPAARSREPGPVAAATDPALGPVPGAGPAPARGSATRGVPAALPTLDWQTAARLSAVAVVGLATLLHLAEWQRGDRWLEASTVAWLDLTLVLTAWAALARSRPLSVVAAVSLVPALISGIGRLHPDNAQAYALPIGLYLLAVAMVVRYMRGRWRRWAATAIAACGLLVLLGVGVVQSLDSRQFGYALLTLVEGLVLVGVGIAVRWRVLAVGGVAGVVIIAVRQLFDAVAALPGWAILGGSGMLLLGGAVVLLLMRARLVAAGRSAAERWSGWD